MNVCTWTESTYHILKNYENYYIILLYFHCELFYLTN